MLLSHQKIQNESSALISHYGGRSSFSLKKDLEVFPTSEYGFFKEKLTKRNSEPEENLTKESSNIDPVEEFLLCSGENSTLNNEPRRLEEEQKEKEKTQAKKTKRKRRMRKEVEVDLSFFKKYEIEEVEPSAGEELKKKGKSSGKAKREMKIEEVKNLPDPTFSYRIHQIGQLSTFPCSLYEPSEESDEQVGFSGVKKAIKKQKKISKKNSKIYSKIMKNSLTERVKAQILKQNTISKIERAMRESFNRSKTVNKSAGIELNAFLLAHMKCAIEDHKLTLLDQKRKKLVNLKQKKMLRVLKKREKIQKKIEKAFEK